MRVFSHVAHEVDDLLDVIVAEEVVSRCHDIILMPTSSPSLINIFHQ